jgi:hypothetical protein
MNEFLNLFRASVYSPTFYERLHEKSWAFSFRFFYAVVLIVSLIFTVVASYEFFTFARMVFTDSKQAVIDTIPDGVEITIKKNVISINQPVPYYFPLRPEIRSVLQKNETRRIPGNALVVDTESDFSSAKFPLYDSLFVITRDGVAYENERGARFEPMGRIPDMTITRATVAAFWDKVQRIIKWVSPIAVLFILMVMIGAYSMVLVLLFLGAVLVYIIARLRGRVLRYWQAYRAAVHMSVFSILVGSILMFIPPLAVPLPLFLFVSLAILTWVNFPPLKKEAAVAASAPDQAPE